MPKAEQQDGISALDLNKGLHSFAGQGVPMERHLEIVKAWQAHFSKRRGSEIVTQATACRLRWDTVGLE